MKIVAGTPASRAAQATDWPWLPAVAATTPAARSESLSQAILLTAPRILTDPVRCRFSAFSRTLRPVARENVSDGKTGVTFATPSMRSRAARMSASVGPIAVQVEDLLEDLANRGERVELPRLDLVEQAAELRIVGDGLLEMLLRARRRDREHLAREVLAAARRELALGLEEPAVLGDLLPELVDPLAVHGLGQHDRRLPGALGVERQDRAHLVQHCLRGRVVHLVDCDHVGNLHDPGLQRLHRVAGAGHQHEQDRVGDPDHLDLALARAHSLEEDEIFAGG